MTFKTTHPCPNPTKSLQSARDQCSSMVPGHARPGDILVLMRAENAEYVQHQVCALRVDKWPLEMVDRVTTLARRISTMPLDTHATIHTFRVTESGLEELDVKP